MNNFSLLTEPWIPIVEDNDHSLLDVFSNKNLSNIGGSSIDKISIFKLLLAIGQAAWTPQNDKEWKEINIDIFSEKVINYLTSNRKDFYLYGDKPFLQYKELKDKIKLISCFNLMPDISTGNNILIFDSQRKTEITDKDKALILINNMNFPLGGKKVNNSISFAKNYQKKKGGAPGSSLGILGYLHSFYIGDSILETIYINILTTDDINSIATFSEGLGIPPWKSLPKEEIGNAAIKYSHTYYGNLLALNRFLLLSDNSPELYNTEGIIPNASYKEGIADLTCTLIPDKKSHRIVWCSTDKKPWRQFTALLSFLNATRTSKIDTTLQIELVTKRLKTLSKKRFKIWSGGISTSNNAGEQYLTGTDDILSSEQPIDIQWLGNIWYAHLQTEMENLDKISKLIYMSVKNYYKERSSFELSKSIPEKATSKFWTDCELLFPHIMEVSNDYNDKSIKKLRMEIISIANDCYSTYCPFDSARQLVAHVKCKPNFLKYIPNNGGSNE